VVGAILLTACEAGAPEDSSPSAPDVTPSVPGSPEAPSFRFVVGDREVMPTEPGRVGERMRRRAREAADQVESLVTDLYVGGFLDPGQWAIGTYDVFALFAGGARAEARQRTGVLTAGAEAGDRFERIEPMKGRLLIRILLDRGGKPLLVASKVRFRARGVGPEPVLIRSDGSFLFRRVEGGWRIVSFGVERADRELSAA
jgi:hypothetical protein